jgi:hypothetical protein
MGRTMASPLAIVLLLALGCVSGCGGGGNATTTHGHVRTQPPKANQSKIPALVHRLHALYPSVAIENGATVVVRADGAHFIVNRFRSRSEAKGTVRQVKQISTQKHQSVLIATKGSVGVVAQPHDQRAPLTAAQRRDFRRIVGAL